MGYIVHGVARVRHAASGRGQNVGSGGAEEGNPAGLSSCSGGLRPLVELCVEPAGLCGLSGEDPLEKGMATHSSILT